MTPDEARNLQAGAETDRLIADILDWPGEILPGGSFHREEDLVLIRWSPSTDANHAIEAADAVHLLTKGVQGNGCEVTCEFAGDDMDEREWEVSYWGYGDDEITPLANKVDLWYYVSAPTFALAICRAIAVRAVQQREAVA